MLGRRMLTGLCAIALAASGSLAAGGTAGAAAAKPTWAVGDCFAKADVDKDEVDLSSKVPCSKKHAVQIVGGGPLPASLVTAGRPALLTSGSPARAVLAAQTFVVCNAGNTVVNVYPKLGKKLQPLILSKNVVEFIPAVPGRGGWVLPDAESFAAGVTDLLCIFEPNPAEKGAQTSDVRKLESRKTLEGTRICRDFRADQTGVDRARCDKAHDQESLIYVDQLVAGRPARVQDWQDADWAPFDATCQEFAKVIIRATREELRVRADTDAAAPVNNGRRLIDCVVHPVDEKVKLPAGTLVGVGKKKLTYPKSK
jgi:hypothetical protein